MKVNILLAKYRKFFLMFTVLVVQANNEREIHTSKLNRKKERPREFKAEDNESRNSVAEFHECDEF